MGEGEGGGGKERGEGGIFFGFCGFDMLTYC